MNVENNKIVIAIDGYSSCGKSTLAKDLAKKLNYTYIDSGAMYRAVTLAALRINAIDGIHVNMNELRMVLEQVDIRFLFDEGSKNQSLFMNGENVEDEIRDIEVSDSVSIISKQKEVRTHLVRLQREMGKAKGIVMDGRDIGTVVFPAAELKIFMTAKEDIRAQRRFDEMRSKGSDISMDEVKKNIHFRDYIDETREESPLKRAEDAILLDNSDLSVDEQFEWVLDQYKKVQND